MHHQGGVVVRGEEASQWSMITLLGLVEGDILEYLETQGSTTLYRLVQALEWPSRLVMMGVGALIREGLVIGRQRELEVVLEINRARPAASHTWSDDEHADSHPIDARASAVA